MNSRAMLSLAYMAVSFIVAIALITTRGQRETLEYTNVLECVRAQPQGATDGNITWCESIVYGSSDGNPWTD